MRRNANTERAALVCNRLNDWSVLGLLEPDPAGALVVQSGPKQAAVERHRFLVRNASLHENLFIENRTRKALSTSRYSAHLEWGECLRLLSCHPAEHQEMTIRLGNYISFGSGQVDVRRFSTSPAH